MEKIIRINRHKQISYFVIPFKETSAIIPLTLSHCLSILNIKTEINMLTQENDLRGKFIKSFASLPLNARGEIILVLEEGGMKQPITWKVAYFEVKNNTPKSKEILRKLDGIGLV